MACIPATEGGLERQGPKESPRDRGVRVPFGTCGRPHQADARTFARGTTRAAIPAGDVRKLSIKLGYRFLGFVKFP